FFVVVSHVAHVSHDSDYFERRGILQLAGPKMMANRVLVFEEFLRKCFIDDRYFSRRCRIFIANGSSRCDFGAQSIEESRHHADESRACIVLGSRLWLTFHSNAVIPAI